MPLELFAIFRREGPNWVSGKTVREQPYWDEHAAFMDALFDSGAVYLGGPFSDGGSMVLYRAESLEAAVARQQSDPWLLHGIHAEDGARRWTIFLDGREK